MNLKPRAKRQKRLQGPKQSSNSVLLFFRLFHRLGFGPVFQLIKSTNHRRKRKTARTAHQQTFCGPNEVLYHLMLCFRRVGALLCIEKPRSQLGGYRGLRRERESRLRRNLCQIGPKVLKKGFGHHHHLCIAFVVIAFSALSSNHATRTTWKAAEKQQH